MDRKPGHLPDGEWIAFYCEDGEKEGMAVIPSVKGHPDKQESLRWMPEDSSIESVDAVAWRADSKALLYIAKDEKKDIFYICAQPINGGKATKTPFLEGARVELFSYGWSPDGKYLAYSRGVVKTDIFIATFK